VTDLVTIAARDSAQAEAYRGLRANLLAIAGDARAFLVASPAPGAGAADAAANLAVVCAQGGMRVTLVDADLRAPTLHAMFGLTNEQGLAGAIEGGTPAPGPTAVSGLRVLPAGVSALLPSDLFARPSAAEAIGALRTDSDLVFLLAAPALAASDAATLARLVDGVILVLAEGQSRRDDAVRARAAFDQVGARVLGVVLTGAAPSDSGYRYFRGARTGGAARP
jgi:non-specific protein-tyrosine kinase